MEGNLSIVDFKGKSDCFGHSFNNWTRFPVVLDWKRGIVYTVYEENNLFGNFQRGVVFITYGMGEFTEEVPLGKGIFLLFTEEVTQWNVWKALYVVV